MNTYTYRFTAQQAQKSFHAGSVKVNAPDEDKAERKAEEQVIDRIGGSMKEFKVKLRLKEVN